MPTWPPSELGDTLKAQGDLAGALVAYRQSLDIAREIAAKDPSNAAGEAAVIMGLQRLGDVLKAQRDISAALSAYSEGVDIARRLASKDPVSPSMQTNLAYALVKLAEGGNDPRGRLNEALSILTGLQTEGRLPVAQQQWIDLIKGAIAKLP